jgi:hypothetical protein
VKVPSEADWHDWPSHVERSLDLDEEYARKTFAGKSFEEALQLFRTNLLSRQEDLYYMPPVPFRYYTLAFKSHVLSDAALEDECDAASAASAFLHLVERKLQSDADSIGPIMSDLIDAVEFVAINQERYSANRDIFGDFLEQLERIRELWRA